MNVKVTLEVKKDSYYTHKNTDLILETNEIDSDSIKLTLTSSDSERYIIVDRNELLKALKLLSEG